MAELSRRTLLKTGSLGLLAGAAALSGIDRLASVPALAGEKTDLSAVGDDVVAHVRNASTGEVAVMVGEREVVAHDPKLVARLLAAARTAKEA